MGQFSVTSLMNAPFFPCVKGFLSVKKPLLMDYQNVNIMNLIWSFRCNKVLSGVVGHRSIVDKSSAYRAKGPGFCSFEKIKLRLGPTFKKKVLSGGGVSTIFSFSSCYHTWNVTCAHLCFRCIMGPQKSEPMRTEMLTDFQFQIRS